MTVLSIERIEVGEGLLEAVVRVAESWMRTSDAAPGFARRLHVLPGLARHTCENESGRSFMVEALNTETAHLVEHVSSELMALSGSPRSLRGETAWDFAKDGRGVFRVRLAFDDDVVAIGALKEATMVVEWLLTGTDKQPDVDGVVQRLMAARA